jgi:hypothetical protein
MLKKYPEKRFSAEDVLNHAFFMTPMSVDIPPNVAKRLMMYN